MTTINIGDAEAALAAQILRLNNDIIANQASLAAIQAQEADLTSQLGNLHVQEGAYVADIVSDQNAIIPLQAQLTALQNHAAPVVSIAGTAHDTTNVLARNYDASVTFSDGSSLVAITWAFDTQNSAYTPTTLSLAAHNFVWTAPGVKVITVTVTDSWGASSSYSLTETVGTPPPPPPPPPPAITYGAPDGSGIVPSGPGIVPYSSLTGADITAKLKSAGAVIVALPVGVQEDSDFKHGLNGAASPSGNAASVIQWPAGLKGIVAPGAKYATLRVKAGSSTKGSTVPAQGSGATNQLYLFDCYNLPDNAIIDGFTLEGTDLGHLYGGRYMNNPGDKIVISNCIIKGIPGNAGSPPGEVFDDNAYRQAAGKTLTYDHCTFDGHLNGTPVSAALAGTNNTAGIINYNYCDFIANQYSSTVTIWELAKGAVINMLCPRTNAGSHRNIGGEALGGTINITDPLLADPSAGEDDIRITWTAAYNECVINVYFTTQAACDVFFANRTNKKILTICSVGQNYGGSNTPYTGTKKITDNCHVFIAGVEQKLSDFWTFTGKISN